MLQNKNTPKEKSVSIVFIYLLYPKHFKLLQKQCLIFIIELNEIVRYYF